MKLVEKAEQIAREAHKNQFRRDGITPYIEHPKAVVQILKDYCLNDLVLSSAWLHDVLEDTSVTAEDLKTADIPSEVIEVVELLTKPNNIDYEKYIAGITTNYIASEVKCADILHNLSDSPSTKAN